MTSGAEPDVEVVEIDRAAAFSAFYREHHPKQVRRAYLLVGSSAVAAELVHDVMRSIFERWAEIERPAAYLNRSVMNACWRHRRRGSRIELGRDRDVAEDQAELTSLPDTDEVEIADLLLALAFRQRAAIVLRFYVGMTENEIADVLGCRPGSVGPAISRGLAKLREALQ
jgi:RNA polymerase sigma factor (sigma-70 family)